MNSDDDGNFADHREHILKTAKALVQDTKVLVAGAAGSQDQLAAAAQNAVTTIRKLSFDLSDDGFKLIKKKKILQYNWLMLLNVVHVVWDPVNLTLRLWLSMR